MAKSKTVKVVDGASLHPKKGKGRPSLYSDELADLICQRIIDKRSLRAACQDDDIPGETAIYSWLAKYPDFANKYARAKAIVAEAMAEEILAISDDGSNDYLVDVDGNQKINQEHVQRSRLRVDTRKWLLSKLLPKKYGDRLEVDNKGELGLTVVVKKYSELDTAK